MELDAGFDVHTKSKWQFLWLFPVIHSGFGTFFAYDAIGALSPMLKEELDLNNLQIGLLYSAYSLSSVLLSVVCGIFVDKFGPKKMMIVTTAINSVGTAIVALAPDFGIMLFGQLLYGLGSAPLYITIVTTLQIWFAKSSNPGFFTTLAICSCACWLRLGSFMAFLTLPIIESHSNLRVALWVSCGTCVSSFVSAVIFATFSPWKPIVEHSSKMTVEAPSVDSNASRTQRTMMQLRKYKEMGIHHVKKLKLLPASYWCISFIFIFAVPSIYSFSAFGTIILEENYGYKSEDAAQITSFISLTNALTSPPMGLLVGRLGYRTIFTLFGTALLGLLYFVFTMKWILAIVIFLGVGFAQSILDSVIFPSISIVVAHDMAGVATGFMMLWYDTVLTILPIIVGLLKDETNYIVTLATLACIAAVTFISSVLLKIADIKADHVLDKISDKKHEEILQMESPKGYRSRALSVHTTDHRVNYSPPSARV